MCELGARERKGSTQVNGYFEGSWFFVVFHIDSQRFCVKNVFPIYDIFRVACFFFVVLVAMNVVADDSMYFFITFQLIVKHRRNFVIFCADQIIQENSTKAYETKRKLFQQQRHTVAVAKAMSIYLLSTENRWDIINEQIGTCVDIMSFHIFIRHYLW